jgi:hypothetical protein
MGPIVDALPIALPDSGRYLFHVRGDVLYISSRSKGISAYRLTDASKVTCIELAEDGVHLFVKNRGSIGEVVLLRQPVSIPAQAATFRSLDAPVELLEEYAALHMRAESGSLSQDEFDRREELIGLIGKEYERRKRSRVVSSRRSVPESSGESRSGGSRSAVG